MLYLYLDESGDLGFDFISKKPSKFFTICILMLKSHLDRKRMIKMIERTLRNKVNPKGKRKRMAYELKGSSTTFQIKEYFYRHVGDLDFQIYSITLNKRRVYQRLVEDKGRVYNWVARLLLDQIEFCSASDQVNLVLDRSKSRPEITEFDKYILAQLKGKIDPKVLLVIRHKDSREDLCLNAVDLFAWGVFRKYEEKDVRWYDVFKSKMCYEGVYLK